MTFDFEKARAKAGAIPANSTYYIEKVRWYDEHASSALAEIERLRGENGRLNEENASLADAAYDAAPDVPISGERVNEIVTTVMTIDKLEARAAKLAEALKPLVDRWKTHATALNDCKCENCKAFKGYIDKAAAALAEVEGK